jgi:hypothetical protein
VKILLHIILTAAVQLTRDSVPLVFGDRWVAMPVAMPLHTFEAARAAAARPAFCSLCLVRRLPDQLKLIRAGWGPSAMASFLLVLLVGTEVETAAL